MKKIIIALFVGLSAMVHGQNKITGTVFNSKNEPLTGVSIQISDLQKSTSTNTNGQFTISNLPKGSLKIVFSMIGYQSKIEIINISSASKTLNIVLENTIFQIDEIIVSTAFNKLQSQNVMKVEHATTKDFQQKGATTLIEGISQIPGLSQISTGVSIGKPVIRGLSANRVLVYSQGVRLENQQFGEEHGLGLNDAGIESVEVIKGPASLLYGSDAMGGVLYFNPERFADANTVKSDFGQRYFSNTQGFSTNFGVKTSGEKWKFLARGSQTAHADYQTPSLGRVTNSRYNETDFKIAVGYNDKNLSSTLRYNFNKLDIGIPENGIAEQTTNKTSDFPKQGVSNKLLSWNNVLFFGNSKLDFDLGYIANDRSEFAETNAPDINWRLNTLNYNVKYHAPKIGKLESIIGIQGMRQTNTNFGNEFLIPNATTTDFGAFVTTNYQWNTNVLQAGLRFDNRKLLTEAKGTPGDEGSFVAIDRKFDSFNASLGYKTNLQQNLTLRLNVASGFRAPNLAELTSNGVHEGSLRYEIGNANLKNEQNVQVDLNLEYANSHFEFFVNGFYNHINNYIFVAPTGNQQNGFDEYVYNQQNAKLFGGEAGIHFHPHPLDWLHFESSFQNVTATKQNGEYLPLIPANVLNNTIKTDFKIKKWLSQGFASFNVSHTFAQNNNSSFETKTLDYTLVNLGLGGYIKLGNKAFNFNLNANNLLNKTYISHLSRLKNDGIPNIGLNVVAGVNFNL